MVAYSWSMGFDLRVTLGTDLGFFGGGEADGLEFGMVMGFIF
jgi:hypothetical protein